MRDDAGDGPGGQVWKPLNKGRHVCSKSWKLRECGQKSSVSRKSGQRNPSRIEQAQNVAKFGSVGIKEADVQELNIQPDVKCVDVCFVERGM